MKRFQVRGARPDELVQAERGGTHLTTPQRARGSRLRRVAATSLWVGLVLALVGFAVLLHRVADAVRSAPLREMVYSGDAAGLLTSAPEFTARLSTFSATVLAEGHELEVLTDAELIERMLADLGTAQRSITVLGYSCEPGRLGDRLAAILAERARAGVDVRFLGDGFGCRTLLRRIGEPLRAAGAAVATFRPVRWFSLHRAQHRMHARTVLIDGMTGYTGGFGIADKWVADQPGDPLWRDTGVRVTGPALEVMQSTFLSAWAEATGELLIGEAYFPEAPQPRTGAALAGFLYSAPAIGTTPAERYLALLLAGAEHRLFIANSYFVPTPLMLRLLADAARRGVDVRLLLPGEKVDIRTSRYAGRSHFEELLTAGVRIFEYQPAMMHAKTIVVDGAWVTLGSLNLDNRSLRLNDEGALIARDEKVGATMDSLFLADLSRSREIILDGHRARPLRQRIAERLSLLLAPLL